MSKKAKFKHIFGNMMITLPIIFFIVMVIAFFVFMNSRSLYTKMLWDFAYSFSYAEENDSCLAQVNDGETYKLCYENTNSIHRYVTMRGVVSQAKKDYSDLDTIWVDFGNDTQLILYKANNGRVYMTYYGNERVYNFKLAKKADFDELLAYCRLHGMSGENSTTKLTITKKGE